MITQITNKDSQSCHWIWSDKFCSTRLLLMQCRGQSSLLTNNLSLPKVLFTNALDTTKKLIKCLIKSLLATHLFAASKVNN